MIRAKKCALCDNKIFFDTKTKKLKDGFSWGKISLPTKNAKIIYEQKERYDILNQEITVIDYDKYRKIEYLECFDCYY